MVIHAATKVHSGSNDKLTDLAAFRYTNVDGTLSLAKQAASSGVKRFIFISSVKVQGERSNLGQPIKESDGYAPVGPYATTKMEAELQLRRLSDECGMELVIIRPPIVYGPSARSNFRTLINAVSRGLPLPLGNISNFRSLIALDNLVDFIAICLEHPGAANQTFSVSDGEDLSTPDLLRRIGGVMHKPVRLLPIPVSLLKLGAIVVGKQDIFQRLCGNLQVDITKARQLLGWTPPITVDEGLHRAAGKTSLG
jgi:UDP-glucose 4-epimerase